MEIKINKYCMYISWNIILPPATCANTWHYQGEKWNDISLDIFVISTMMYELMTAKTFYCMSLHNKNWACDVFPFSQSLIPLVGFGTFSLLYSVDRHTAFHIPKGRKLFQNRDNCSNIFGKPKAPIKHWNVIDKLESSLHASTILIFYYN